MEKGEFAKAKLSSKQKHLFVSTATDFEWVTCSDVMHVLQQLAANNRNKNLLATNVRNRIIHSPSRSRFQYANQNMKRMKIS